MKPIVTAALLVLFAATAALAGEKKQDLSILMNESDSRARLAGRHVARDARLAVTTRHGVAVILLLDDAVAVQLTDAAMADVKPKADAGFLEELVLSGVRLAVGKSVEYPIANIRSAELRGGVLMLTNDEGKPVFDQIRINGEEITHDLAPADAARFVAAFRAVKGRR